MTERVPRWRCQLSQTGRRMLRRRFKDLTIQGTARRRPGGTYVYVQWDGYTVWEGYHPDFIARAVDESSQAQHER